MEVRIEIAAAGSDMWQAVDTPTPVEETVAADWRRPGEIADAVADHYASQQAHDDAAPGMQVRATVTVTLNEGEVDETTETLAVSDIYVVTAPPTPGRPAIGGTVSTAIGTERLAQVDAQAARYGVSRAEAIRRLLDVALVLDAPEGDGPARSANAPGEMTDVTMYDTDMNPIGTPTAEITPRLIGAWFPRVGTRVRQFDSQPFRKVVKIDEFREVRRFWVGEDDYFDVGRQDTIFVPAGEDEGPAD